MWVSHPSSSSFGRAFSAGKAPTIPARHWAMTRSGLEMMNSGAPITGRASFCRRGGRGMGGRMPLREGSVHALDRQPRPGDATRMGKGRAMAGGLRFGHAAGRMRRAGLKAG